MKWKKPRSTKRLGIKVVLTNRELQILKQLGNSPREFLIQACRTEPNRVRSFTPEDFAKLGRNISATQMAQLVVRTFLQGCEPPTPAELAKLGQASGSELVLLFFRDFLEVRPDRFRFHLEAEVQAIEKSLPFEKRTNQLFIELTSAENEKLRRLAARMRVGPTDLARMQIQKFCHEFPSEMMENQPCSTGCLLNQTYVPPAQTPTKPEDPTEHA